MNRSRSEYLRPAGPAPDRTEAEAVRARLVDDADRERLAVLLLDAYRGTIDDEGEDEQDALDAIDGSLARIRRNASVVLEHAAHAGHAASAAHADLLAMAFVVTVLDRAYIDPVATAAAHKRRGLGRAAVAAAIARLDPAEPVGAVITDGNTASERLFAGLGFVRVGPWPRVAG